MSFNDELEALLVKHDVRISTQDRGTLMYSPSSECLVILADKHNNVDVMMFDNISAEDAEDALKQMAGIN